MVHGKMAAFGHEQVTHFVDDETGLEAIVAIHDTTLGPSLGGTRLLPYESHDAALRDVMRLSRAMTYKAAAADLDLGGGKAVIRADPTEKTEDLMAAYGRMIDRLGGYYITSVDVNTGVADMDIIAGESEHVVGTSAGLGDPSPITSRGVFEGLRACVEATYGTPDVDGLSVVVQGVGKVGSGLAELLDQHGAEVAVSDIDEEATAALAREYGFETVAPSAVYEQPCDVFAPCAIGGVVNDETIPQFECDIVAGGANNILDERAHAQALHDRDILYAPDYVLNAGGLITVAAEHTGATREQALADAVAIGDRTRTLIERADAEDVTVLEAADRYALDRIEAARSEAVSPSSR
ncbi:Leu/Phe/Val dehydrogenase [Natronosalvus halobius]|uniref:Leu/Phe/Val dehydrogenase n=1 Tax=Natronosalvus halobius TaxID=2953746 RepID=UPI0020A0D4F5|nr:Glu/Leu/Phe/Val dehydrogenase dimerization domain-containing protein [Natronosalvus halobius]USZ71968.1 leucine dehydrogenase [Natronosalvus halobius]